MQARLKDLQENHKGLWQKIKDFFKGWLDRVRKMLQQDTGFTKKELQAWDKLSDEIQSKLATMWGEGTADMARNLDLTEGVKLSEFQGTENAATEGGEYTQYAERDNAPNDINPEGKTLQAQLHEAYETSGSEEGRYVYVGRFTDAFRQLVSKYVELKDLPVVMNYRDAYLAMHDESTGKYKGANINYHNLGEDGLEAALTSFDKPIAIIKSPKEGKIEFILPGLDYKGRQFYSIVAVNTWAQNSNRFIEAHVVTTVYGKSSLSNFNKVAAYIEKAKNEGRLINKSEDFTQGIPQVQYKGDINAKSSNDRIAQSGESVNPQNSEGRLSEREADMPSDAELVMGMDEKDSDTPEGKALIREVQAKQKQIETLREKLAEAKRQLTTTKRALNTKGIGNVAGNVIRDFGISDAGGKNIKQQATEILTDVYQKALDQIDSGAAAAA